MDETDKPESHRRTTWPFLVVLLLMFVVYPLSYGPAMVVATRTDTREQVARFYQPMYWVGDRTNLTDMALEYEAWCHEITGTAYFNR